MVVGPVKNPIEHLTEIQKILPKTKNVIATLCLADLRGQKTLYYTVQFFEVHIIVSTNMLDLWFFFSWFSMFSFSEISNVRVSLKLTVELLFYITYSYSSYLNSVPKCSISVQFRQSINSRGYHKMESKKLFYFVLNSQLGALNTCTLCLACRWKLGKRYFINNYRKYEECFWFWFLANLLEDPEVYSCYVVNLIPWDSNFTQTQWET